MESPTKKYNQLLKALISIFKVQVKDFSAKTIDGKNLNI